VACAADEAAVRVTLASGTVLDSHVRHARGSPAHPLESYELAAKVEGLVDPVIHGATAKIISIVEAMPAASSINQLAAVCDPRNDL
jgi:hypothetical protein